MQRVVIPLEISNRAEYQKAEQDVIRYILENEGRDKAIKASRAETLARFNKTKILASQGKMEHVLNWIEDFLESGKKLVVFAVSRESIDTLMEKFGDIAVKIDGSVSTKKRQEAVDNFMKDPKTKLFVGQIVAASEGLTLTSASDVCFIGLPWVPALCSQAECRVLRIGQKNACTAYYLLAHNTIEEDIAEIIDQKTKTISAIVEGKSAPEDSLLTELMNRVKNKKE